MGIEFSLIQMKLIYIYYVFIERVFPKEKKMDEMYRTNFSTSLYHSGYIMGPKGDMQHNVYIC